MPVSAASAFVPFSQDVSTPTVSPGSSTPLAFEAAVAATEASTRSGESPEKGVRNARTIVPAPVTTSVPSDPIAGPPSATSGTNSAQRSLRSASKAKRSANVFVTKTRPRASIAIFGDRWSEG